MLPQQGNVVSMDLVSKIISLFIHIFWFYSVQPTCIVCSVTVGQTLNFTQSETITVFIIIIHVHP